MQLTSRKKLTLSHTPMLSGVCSGIADYFEIDHTLVRLIFVLGTLCFGGGVLFYVLCYLIMPHDKSIGELRRERIKKRR